MTHSVKKVLLYSLTLYLLLFVASCAQKTQKDNIEKYNLKNLTLSPALDKQISDAMELPFPINIETMLTIAQTTEEKKDLVQAKNILDSINYNELPTNLQIKLALQQASIADQQNHSNHVFLWTERKEVVESRDPKVIQTSRILQAKAFSQFEEYSASLDEWIDVLPTLTDQQLDLYSQIIWNTLLNSPKEHITELSERYTNNSTKAWLEIALIYQSEHIMDIKIKQMSRWLARWPHHIAKKYLPGNLENLQKQELTIPKNIAVLLPTSGHLKKAGEAIQRGILSAYYSTLETPKSHAEIQFFDTTTDTIETIIQEINMGKADMIIGPLEKAHVNTMMENKPELPVIALNYSDQTNKEQPTHFFQFGLSTDDEATIIVERAWQDGHKNALIIAPKNDHGNKATKILRESWEKRGGQITSTEQYDNETVFNRFISEILQIRHSYQRIRILKRVLSQPIENSPRRRTDIDAIFLVASPQTARQIRPTLAYNYAGDIPIYATSSVYSGKQNITLDLDLEDIRLPVMPWFYPDQSKNDASIVQTIQSLWPHSTGSYGAFYALGADVYMLHSHLSRLVHFQGNQLHGLTGSLSISPEGRISRKLSWYIFKKGILKPLQIKKNM